MRGMQVSRCQRGRSPPQRGKAEISANGLTIRKTYQRVVAGRDSQSQRTRSLNVSRCVGCKSAGYSGADRRRREARQKRAANGLTRRKTYQRVAAGMDSKSGRKRRGPFLSQVPLSFVSRPPRIPGYLPHCGRDGRRGGRGAPPRTCQRCRPATTPRRRATTRLAVCRRSSRGPRPGGTTKS